MSLERYDNIIDLLRSGALATRYAELIDIQEHPDGGLLLLNYTETCQYRRAWDDVTLHCRGLMICSQSWRVAALPFPKFFNIGETPETSVDALPREAFAVYEKLDGSLGISYCHGNTIALATRGSFTSTQARQGTEYLRNLQHVEALTELTCLFEVICKDARCVSGYDFEGLVLLSAFERSTGRELAWAETVKLAEQLGCRLAKVYPFGNFAEILASRSTLPATFEGYVVRFDSGFRVKVKGDAYNALHKLAAGLTETRILQAMVDGTVEQLRRASPEEFWGDIDRAIAEIEQRARQLEAEVIQLFAQAPSGSDRKTFAAWVLQHAPVERRVMLFHLYDKKPTDWYRYL